MQLGSAHVRVQVPATSANLGPGFDAFGLALGHHDIVEVRALASDSVEVDVIGEGAGHVPTDESHLVVRALRAALEHVGAPLTGLHLTCHNAIPHGRGMGSSAGAVVAGIMAARGLIADPRALNDDVALDIATAFEGHPDNAAPAILGGATIAWMEGVGGLSHGAHAARLDVHPDIEPWVLVPTFQLATKAARGVLPSHVTHADASFNTGRGALLTLALTQRLDLLFAATEDRLHQPFRADVLASSTEVLTSLRAEGLPAVISGAGPTVLVLARASEGDRAQAILDELVEGNESWTVVRPGIDTVGASVERL